MKYIMYCPQCQANKKLGGKPVGLSQPIPIISTGRLDRVTFDYLGPLPASNKKINKYVLVAACNTTKYIFTKVVKNATAEATLKLILEIISH